MSTNRKLTDEQVAEIRQRFAAGGVTCLELAREYGVHPTAISNRVRGPGLTADTVLEICRRYAAGGVTQRTLAREYGVGADVVSRIVRAQIYTLGRVEFAHPITSNNSKLAKSDVRAIRKRYAEGGITHKALAEKYGVSAATVGGIVRRRTYRYVR